jgi:hypothetical protein
MADSFKLLYQGQLPITPAILYTVPAATSTIVKHMQINNPTSSGASIWIWRNGTANANVLYTSVPIRANGGWAEWDGGMALGTGETLWGSASLANTITLTIDGDEVS